MADANWWNSPPTLEADDEVPTNEVTSDTMLLTPVNNNLSPRSAERTTPSSGPNSRFPIAPRISSPSRNNYTPSAPNHHDHGNTRPHGSNHPVNFPTTDTSHYHPDPDSAIPEWSTYHHEHNHKKVDRNTLKRNMTIAKGFMDISLLSANANQLRSLLRFGDSKEATYYIILTGLLISLTLQMATGILLIVMERWNINKLHHQDISIRLNNTTVCLVFLTLVINVMVSSFGVDVMTTYSHNIQQHGVLHIQPRLDASNATISF